MSMTTLSDAVDLILTQRECTPSTRAVLVGISGIDGSGKGFIAAQIEAMLESRGRRVATINVDGWLQLPEKRFDPARPGPHFYEKGIRFDDLFSQLVLPLRDNRSVRLTAQLADATGRPVYESHDFAFDDVDVIVLEGIFLLKHECRSHFDVTLWIECTFETALERALARGQESLPPHEVVRDYRTIYFPAQEIHLAQDNPRAAATAIIVNDDRVNGVVRLSTGFPVRGIHARMMS